MNMFPLVRPRLGLSVTSHSICLIELSRKWQGRRCCRLGHIPLPGGLVQLSPGKPNISELPSFISSLKELAKDVRSPQPVALCLPDLCARTAVFQFTSFPRKEVEREALVRWRFQHDLNLSTEKTRVVYKMYRFPKTSRLASSQTSGTVQVLATAIQLDVIEQYEQACLSAGLLPASVGLASLDVFDFYRAPMQKVIEKTKSQKLDPFPESVLLYLTEWGFSFIALREGCPIFLRIKALRLPSSKEPERNTYSDQDEISDDGSPTPDTIFFDGGLSTDYLNIGGGEARETDTGSGNIAVANEIVATLQFYFESSPVENWAQTGLTLFYAEGVEHGKALLPSVQHVEGRLRSSMTNPPHLNFFALPLGISHLSSQMKSTSNGHQRLALPAFASVMVI